MRYPRFLCLRGSGKASQQLTSALALFHCINDRRFLSPDAFPDKNQLSFSSFKRFQLPTAGHEIEKLRAVGETDETFRPNHARGQSVHETFEAVAGKNVVRAECERFEFWLMLMLGRPGRSLPRLPDAEQSFRIDLAPYRANNCRSRIDFAQLCFERLDLLCIDQIDLVQKQNVRALDLQTRGVTEFRETNQHVRVDYRNDAV